MGRKVGRVTGISTFTDQNTLVKKGMFSLDDRNYFGSFWNKFIARGGTEIPSAQSGNGYKYHVYLSSGTFEVVSGSGNVEYLVIAGGGGGGFGGSPTIGGGGGAGGYRTNIPGSSISTSTSYIVSGPKAYTVVVGGGGNAGPGATNGSPSWFGDATVGGISTITSTGGGYGGVWTSPSDPPATQGQPGGSGGGGSSYNSSFGRGLAGTGNFPPVNPPQGNPGIQGADLVNGYGGRGGGAGGGPIGIDGAPNPNVSSPIIYPTIPVPQQPTWIPAVGVGGTYAGGGGSVYFLVPNNPGWNLSGGTGGGGPGYTNAVANTGGGGGGGNSGPLPSSFYTGPAGNGGSGIVIIRYLD